MTLLATAQTINQFSLDQIIHNMTEALSQKIALLQPKEKIAMIGIHTGGVWIAEKLRANMKLSIPFGTLNIAYYRDDFSEKGLHPSVIPSTLPFDMDESHIILVDDVIMSGRTIRASLNEIFDYGRPQSVTLCTLVDIPHRDLPIHPDITGIRVDLLPNQRIKLTGPDHFSLTVREIASYVSR